MAAGDCLVPGMIQAAVHSGHRVGKIMMENYKRGIKLEVPTA